MTATAIVTQTGIELCPDRARVIARLFVPGREDIGPGDSRAGPVTERILALDEHDIEAAMRDIDDRFCHRHRDLHGILDEHAAMVTSRIDPDVQLSTARRLVLGASFTHEYAIEAAALCNPSMVLHPQQNRGGATAFVMSVRGIGEGHRSSIGFRTGTVTADGTVTVDPSGPFPQIAPPRPGMHHRSVFHAKLGALGDDRDNAAFVLDPLPPVFDDADLEAQIESLGEDVATRRDPSTTIDNLRDLARSSYCVEFPEVTELSERVLWPQTPVESHGMEDARFVRFVDDAGVVTYYGTYTAFDGHHIAQHLLTTTDFRAFAASPMAGPGAVGKGLALFPRKIDGQYAALSRADRETNGVAFSADLRCWDDAHTIQAPTRSWEILQLGNCGSPIETEAGWLVLMHGVGPMRTYSLGALLLDLDDPRVVLARSALPILSPGNDQRDGYVPNVIYTCGAMAHGDVLVLPYGFGDQAIAIATLSIDQLLGTLEFVG